VSDLAVDGWIQKMLSERLRGPSERCPDDSTAAAYLEAGLTRRERAAFEAHVSECRACQEVLALSLRLQDPAGKRILFRVSVPIPALAALIIAVVLSAVLFRILSRPPAAQQAHPEGEQNKFETPASSAAALPIESPSLVRLAGAKRIGDKKFYPVSGYWMDRQCGEHRGDPMVPITSAAPEYEQILARYPELRGLRPALICTRGKVYLLR